MAERALVLGAGGFIGSHLCRALTGQGTAVTAVARRARFLDESLDPGRVTWAVGDFGDPAVLDRALDGCGVVYHLISAATPASSNRDPVADVAGSVIGTLRFLERARICGVRRVVFVSSGGTVYGIPRQEPIPETAPTDPISAYGIGKLALEKYFGLYHYLYGLDHCILRVANPFGPWQAAVRQQGVIAAFMAAAVAGRPLEIWGDGSVVRDYVHVDDVVDALLRAAAAPCLTRRVLNIGSGTGRSLTELTAVLSRAAGRPLAVHHHEGRKLDVPRIVLDISAARDELGWAPTVSWERGIEETYRWYESRKGG